MKFDLIARLGLSTTLAMIFFAGCMQSAKDQEYQPMEMAQEAEVQTSDLTPTADTSEPIPTTLPETSHENLESQLATDTTHEEESPAPIPKTQTTGTDPLIATPLPEDRPAKSAATKKVKALKANVKFKVSKKASAGAALLDDGKNVQVTFTTSKMKKNTYTLMVENSCKKKGKAIKAAQFKVKDGIKFSGKTNSKTISLRSGNSKFVGKKALVLYMGAKANVRVACDMIKIK